MTEIPDNLPDFDPELYQAPQIYLAALRRPGVTAIGNAVDRETLQMIENRARELGRSIGTLTLARKELEADGHPKIDWFPIYAEETISIIGNHGNYYMFSDLVEVKVEHVEEAETFVFTRPEFANLSEDHRRYNVMRLAASAASTDASLLSSEIEANTTFMPLIGANPLKITSTNTNGEISRTYELIEDEESGAQHDEA